MFRFDSDGRGGEIVGGWARPARARAGRTVADADGRRHGGDPRLAVGAGGADGLLRGAEGKLAETMRGYGVQAVVAAPVFLSGRCGAR